MHHPINQMPHAIFAIIHCTSCRSIINKLIIMEHIIKASKFTAWLHLALSAQKKRKKKSTPWNLHLTIVSLRQQWDQMESKSKCCLSLQLLRCFSWEKDPRNLTCASHFRRNFNNYQTETQKSTKQKPETSVWTQTFSNTAKNKSFDICYNWHSFCSSILLLHVYCCMSCWGGVGEPSK